MKRVYPVIGMLVSRFLAQRNMPDSWTVMRKTGQSKPPDNKFSKL